MLRMSGFVKEFFIFLSLASYQGTSSRVQGTKEQPEATPQADSLSVLLISTWLSGHQTHLLGVGGELVKRGHRVAFLSTEVKGSNNLPQLPVKLGMEFVSAGPDPRTKEDYEKIISGLMGRSVLQQRLGIMVAMQEHLFKLRVAIDRLNCSDWDIVLADYTHTMNLVRHLTFTCGIKIVLSASSIIDYASMAPPWPYPSMYLKDSSDDISLYHKFTSAFFYQLFLTGSFGTLLTKLYLLGNDTELWNSVYRDPYFLYPPDVLYPMLYYSVVGVEYAHPHYPTVHMVGPILGGAESPLQEDLKVWLDGKPDGQVVYVSMGTTAVLTRDMATSLLSGVKRAGYSMVWSLRKSNQDIIQGMALDKNRFFVSGWVSQVAALQHRAVGVAILHCGSGGLHEALSNSVPVVCIPYCFDQFSWAGKIQSQGLGLAIFAEDVTTDKVFTSLQTVTSERYREKVYRISKVLKQAGGSSKAAELVEYYAEVGYEHLLPAYVKYRWSWSQYYSLDMYMVIIVTFLCGTVLCCKVCCRNRGS